MWLFLLLGSELAEAARNAILELLPDVAVEPVAQLAVVVHLTPAVSAPLATCHVDNKVTVVLVVVNVHVLAVVAARAWREAVDLALRDKGKVRAHPRLVGIHVLQRILFLVLPFHVFLFVADRVPPDI